MCHLVAQSTRTTEGRVQAGSLEAPDWEGNRAVGNPLFQGVQEPTACHRASARNSGTDARKRQVTRILPGDDLRGFSGGSEVGDRQPRRSLAFADSPGAWSSKAAEGSAPGNHPGSALTGIRANRPRLKLELEAYRELCREVLERDGWRCQWCGRREALQVHHVQPRGRLGDDTEENLITLCVGCHQSCHGVLTKRVR